MFFKNYISLIYFFLFSSLFTSIAITGSFKKYEYGLNVYKKGNCMGCHSWHGKGGGGYGSGVSLRKNKLQLNELINVIKCGRAGTAMPYFLKKSYKEEKCYDTTFEDYDNNYRPVSSKNFLSVRQIEAVSIFIKEILQQHELNKNYCEFFFNKGSKVCENIKN